MSRIFISYRRDDTSGHVLYLYDKLAERFGRQSIFRDIDTIPPGADFVEYIQKAINSCTVVLVLIGKQWLTLQDKYGRRRIDDPYDFVRLEIRAALERPGIVTIPVLVGGVGFPRADDLPPDLHPLTRRNAQEISDRNFHHDVEELIRGLEYAMGMMDSEDYFASPLPISPRDAPQPKAAAPPPQRAPESKKPKTIPPPPAQAPAFYSAGQLHFPREAVIPSPQVDLTLHRLSQVLGFLLEELELNRQGQLSHFQREKFAFWPRFRESLYVSLFYTVIIGLTWFVIALDSGVQDPGAVALFTGMSWGICNFFADFLFILLFYPGSLKVKIVRGQLIRVIDDVKVGKKRLKMLHKVDTNLIPRDKIIYTAYYVRVRRSWVTERHYLLSLEPLSN
jgi:hypothetical protein